MSAAELFVWAAEPMLEAAFWAGVFTAVILVIWAVRKR